MRMTHCRSVQLLARKVPGVTIRAVTCHVDNALAHQTANYGLETPVLELTRQARQSNGNAFVTLEHGAVMNWKEPRPCASVVESHWVTFPAALVHKSDDRREAAAVAIFRPSAETWAFQVWSSG